MSKVQKIEEILFLNFKEGDVFTTTTLQRLAVENGIITEDNNTAVGNTLFNLKNDIRLKRIGRGQYQVTYKNSDMDEGDSTETMFEQLISRLKNYKLLNPVNTDRNTMLKASEEVDKYRKYIRTLQHILES
ncbi:MAG: hypothetical protein MRZ41_08195 [Eubacterium sp.]|nr:hypothetical protein [Eubacterium sp.]